MKMGLAVSAWLPSLHCLRACAACLLRVLYRRGELYRGIGLNIVRVLFLEMLVERGSPVLGHLSSHRTLGMLHTSRHTGEHVGISFFSVKFCAKEERVLDL